MPLYEYECQQCHRRIEKIQKFSDPELTVCPFCAGPLERTLTAPAVHFAGGGWYKDLYSSAKTSPDKGAAKSEAPASGSAPSASAGAAPSPSNGSAAPSSSPPAASTSAPAAPASSKS